LLYIVKVFKEIMYIQSLLNDIVYRAIYITW